MVAPTNYAAMLRETVALVQKYGAAEAARRLRLSESTVRHRMSRARDDGVTVDIVYEDEPIPAPQPPSSDPVDIARLKMERNQLRRDLDAMTRRAQIAEDVRAGVFGLMSEPVEPIAFPAPNSKGAQAEAIVCVLSDLHWGESVDIEAMDGLNSYSLDIARARLARWADAVIDLSTRHWSGPRPARFILVLGGDLVSGEIHGELAKTNEAKALPAVRDLVTHLSSHIVRIRTALPDIPMDIISLVGNHGRSTLKPESKQTVETSYDALVSDFLEVTIQNGGDTGLTFYSPKSVDAVFTVFGWRLMATHGDRIGSRGGQGFIGPAATAARGFKRIVQDYAARGVLLDIILICHFHTPLMLEEGFVNGSLPGPTEYSRDGRFKPHPAQQLFFTIHPRRRVAQVRWIEVGHPDEGALYAPPPEDRPQRPRYRVPAIVRRV